MYFGRTFDLSIMGPSHFWGWFSCCCASDVNMTPFIVTCIFCSWIGDGGYLCKFKSFHRSALMVQQHKKQLKTIGQCNIYTRFRILFVFWIKGKKEMIIHIRSQEQLVDCLIPINLFQNFVELKAN